MKKVLLSLVVVGLLVSCAGAETLTLALRSGTYAEVIKKCLHAFEAKHNVKTEVLELAEDDLHSKLALDAANSEGAYDLCMVDGSWMAEFSSNGVLADLVALGYDLDEDDDVIPGTTKIARYGWKLYLAPYYGNVTVLLYNKALVNGQPMNSLEDLLKICKAAKESGKKGFIYRGDTENNIVVDFMPILLSFGGWVLNDDDKPSVNTDTFKAAVKFYLELIATGDAEAKDDLIATIDNGSGAMGIGWPGWYLPTETSNADYSAITGRVNDSSEAHNANVYGVWTLGITANSTHKALTVERACENGRRQLSEGVDPFRVLDENQLAHTVAQAHHVLLQAHDAGNGCGVRHAAVHQIAFKHTAVILHLSVDGLDFTER